MSLLKKFNYRARYFVWLILFLPFTVVQVHAQHYFFDNYSIKQGLSVQKVYSLLQDANDYIWLGTANGVSRFDGNKFENFTSQDSLASGGVRSLFEDSSGSIWFGHMNGGVSRFNGRNFGQATFDSLKITGDVTSIVQIDDKLWITSSYDGALRVDFPLDDIKNIKAKQYRGREGLSDQVFGSTVNKDESFICVADVGLRRFNKEDEKFENYRMPHYTTYFQSTCLLEDREGNIWFGTQNGGIYKYIMSESRMEIIDLIKTGFSSNWITCFTEDSRGRIWVGTWEGGIAVFDGAAILKFNEESGLKASKIYDIIEDVEGNILIADQDNGLTIYKGDAFQTINDEKILPITPDLI